MSDDVTPIRHVGQTCTQRQDAAIAKLEADIEALRSRVAALAAPAYIHSPSYPQDDGEITDSGYTYREINDALSSAPVVVPILDSVEWDTGMIRWTSTTTADGLSEWLVFQTLFLSFQIPAVISQTDATDRSSDLGSHRRAGLDLLRKSLRDLVSRTATKYASPSC